VFLLRRVSPNPAFGRNVGDFIPRKKMSGGNIKAESAYDPFPRSGLVKQFEPFIRKEVGKFCKRYPKLRRDDVLFEAIRLALTAEKKFNPKLGYVDAPTPPSQGPASLCRARGSVASRKRGLGG
jgi:hypothetical protein